MTVSAPENALTMLIRYSKNAVATLAKMRERDRAPIFEEINKLTLDPCPVKLTPIASKPSSHKMIPVGEHRIVLRRSVFRGEPGYFIMEVMDEEDYYYYSH